MVQTVYTSARNVDVRNCDKPILLEKRNFLSEFRTELEKAKARRSLGIYEGDDLTWENIKGFVDQSEALVQYIKNSLSYSNDLSEDISTVNEALDFILVYIEDYIQHKEDYADLLEEVATVKSDMTSLQEQINKTLDEEIESMRESLNEEIESVRATLDEKTASIKSTLDEEVSNMKSTVNESLQDVETRVEAAEETVQDLKNNITDAMVYTTDLEDTIKSTSSVGGLKSGTSVSDLRGKTISAILDDMLFPTTIRNLIQPTLRYNISSQLVEIGTALFNPVLTFTKNDAGAETNRTEVLLYNSQETSDITYSQLGAYTHKATVEYEAGEYLTDSKGNITDKRIEAGSLTTSFVITTTYPWYAGAKGAEVKQSLVKFNTSSGTISLTLGGQSVIKLPGANSSISSFKVNGGLGFLDVDLGGWTESTEEMNGITYKVWTKNDSYSSDLPHQINFTLSL